MDAGELVPDSVTNAMVMRSTAAAGCAAGFLLDGYPRNAEQADVLADYLAEHGRAARRRRPARRRRRARAASGLFERAREQGRSDDTDEVIRRRLEIYHATTEPLVDYYRDRGLLRTVDGVGSVDDVTARILAALRR